MLAARPSGRCRAPRGPWEPGCRERPVGPGACSSRGHRAGLPKPTAGRAPPRPGHSARLRACPGAAGWGAGGEGQGVGAERQEPQLVRGPPSVRDPGNASWELGGAGASPGGGPRATGKYPAGEDVGGGGLCLRVGGEAMLPACGGAHRSHVQATCRPTTPALGLRPREWGAGSPADTRTPCSQQPSGGSHPGVCRWADGDVLGSVGTVDGSSALKRKETVT